jgi:hypothetical protein
MVRFQLVHHTGAGGRGIVPRWKIWCAISVIFIIIAEALNIFMPDPEYLQWLFFFPAVVCFLVGITAWDRRKRPRDDE